MKGRLLVKYSKYIIYLEVFYILTKKILLLVLEKICNEVHLISFHKTLIVSIIPISIILSKVSISC